jgi:acyl-coenzyme A synthetase/AMP-(fatty) acid ligase/acyl carrier protein
VLLPQGGLANLLQWQNRQPHLNAPARTLQFASFSFDVSFQELFSTWQQGGTLVMIDEELRRDLPALAKYLSEHRIGRMFLPYAALQPLAECILHADLQSSLDLDDVIVAGEQLQITPALRQLFGASGARLHNHYGPSETHVVTAYTLDSDVEAWPSLPPIGRPVANTQMYVLDEFMQPLPIGVPGELYIGGVQVALGYLHRDELTAEKFVADPFADSAEARLYRTGDRARYRQDGNIEYLGRTDDQVKWRGFRIEPGEIESLLAAHPGIAQAAVQLREDEPGDKRLIAYLVGEAGTEPDTSVMRAYAKEHLPDYMVPSAFVTLATMPLTPSGKVNRRQLPAPGVRSEAGGAAAVPENRDQKMLALIWQALLKTERVGLDDNFFDLGGHSLMTIELVRHIENATGMQLSIADVFENQTIRELAQLLDGVSWDTTTLPEQSRPGFLSRLLDAIAGRLKS